MNQETFKPFIDLNKIFKDFETNILIYKDNHIHQHLSLLHALIFTNHLSYRSHTLMSIVCSLINFLTLINESFWHLYLWVLAIISSIYPHLGEWKYYLLQCLLCTHPYTKHFFSVSFYLWFIFSTVAKPRNTIMFLYLSTLLVMVFMACFIYMFFCWVALTLNCFFLKVNTKTSVGEMFLKPVSLPNQENLSTKREEKENNFIY